MSNFKKPKTKNLIVKIIRKGERIMAEKKVEEDKKLISEVKKMWTIWSTRMLKKGVDPEELAWFYKQLEMLEKNR